MISTRSFCHTPTQLHTRTQDRPAGQQDGLDHAVTCMHPEGCKRSFQKAPEALRPALLQDTLTAATGQLDASMDGASPGPAPNDAAAGPTAAPLQQGFFTNCIRDGDSCPLHTARGWWCAVQKLAAAAPAACGGCLHHRSACVPVGGAQVNADSWGLSAHD